jgi:hypothetical protein
MGDVVLTLASTPAAGAIVAQLGSPRSPIGATAPDGFQMGSSMAQVSVQDTAGQPVASFGSAATLTLRPSDADVSDVDGDLTRLSIAALDELAGAWAPLPTVVNDDGTLSASVGNPGVFVLLEAAN